ncbi:MAG: glycosyltransferase [Candidatus Daviesbacteria bacterium]|nr:glycosyltransferase [Candidatus Daviesbacteria bacterium]
MKVAIVHDDLVQWGGAERVLEGICQIYPEAPIFTSVFDRSNPELAKRFGSRKIVTSFLQKIPGWRFLYKALLPLYPIAFEQFNFDEFDLVISHTTRFAKAILTKPGTVHIAYCHTPPRFLYNFGGQFNFPILKLFLNWLKHFDKISSARVDYFLAGSKNAQKRIKQIYGRDSQLLYPYVDLKRFKNIESFDGGYFLVVARLNKYKRVDLIVGACQKLELPLKIVGTGSERKNLESRIKNQGNIEFLGQVNDELLVHLLAGCRALIVAGEEDFGLTPLEAGVLGKPVIAFGSGGSLETVINGKTGILFEEQTVESLIAAIQKFEKVEFNSADVERNANRFSWENFKSSLQEIVASVVYTS